MIVIKRAYANEDKYIVFSEETGLFLSLHKGWVNLREETVKLWDVLWGKQVYAETALHIWIDSHPEEWAEMVAMQLTSGSNT